jgi:site-specific recombinase XerD
MLSGFVTVRVSRNGGTRRVPLNSTARAALLDVATRRERPNDPNEGVSTAAYRTTARAIERAVEAAQATLTAAEKDASRLQGHTWHGNRHTFASRLVMTGVDLRTVQELGGWRTLAPERLVSAVERLVPTSATAAPGASEAAPQLRPRSHPGRR